MRKIEISEEVYNQIEHDRKDFERVIGGGPWSTNDTLEEYLKILKTLK